MPIVDRLRKVVELHGGNATGVMTIEQGVKRLESLDFGDGSGAITDELYKNHEFTGSESIFSASDILYVGNNAFAYATLASGVSALTLNLPGCEAIGVEAFKRCSAFSKVTAEDCKYIGESAFWNCNVQTVSFPEAVIIGKEAFFNCLNIVSLAFPKVEYIADRAFDNCKSFLGSSSCLFPKLSMIGSQAFFHCDNMSMLILSSVNYISPYAVGMCSNLTVVNFLGDVRYIDDNAFAGNPKLSSVFFFGNSVVCRLGKSIFQQTPIASGSGFIYVPPRLFNEYVTSPDWAPYSAQLRSSPN